MLRIVAGEWGGRRIQAPRGKSTRPTSDRVREAIFNVLVHRLPLERARIYDLYAGSGALGIEALSRGALHATFVETDGRSAALIRRNLQGLGAAGERWRVVGSRVLPCLKGEAFSPGPLVILLDPPYASDEAQRALGLGRGPTGAGVDRPLAGHYRGCGGGGGIGRRCRAGAAGEP